MTRYRVTYVDSILRVAFIDADSPESALEAATAETENAQHHHALDTWTDDWQAKPAQDLSARSCFECGKQFAA